LIEIMLAIAILAIAVVGASSYRYYSTLDARRADMRSTSARIGMLLCENWRGLNGDATYDPVARLGSQLDISEVSLGGSLSYAGFTPLQTYVVVVDDINYYVALSWRDVNAGLRALNVVVAWAQRDQGSASVYDADKTFKLTTYAAI
jgi:Tfp pilus assembly protein PilV